MFRPRPLAVFAAALLLGPGAGLHAQAGRFGSLPDPTRPPDYEAHADAQTGAAEQPASPRGLQLSSVLISQGRRLAVINGQVLAEGEAGAGFTVRSIQPGEVIVALADNQLTRLTLSSRGVVEKTPVGSEQLAQN